MTRWTHRIAIALALAFTLGTVQVADAKRKFKVPAALKDKSNVLDDFDPEEKFKLPNGKTVDAQHLVDMAGHPDHTDTVKKLGDEDLDEDTKKKVDEQDVDHEVHTKALKAKKHKANSKKAKARSEARKKKKADKKAGKSKAKSSGSCGGKGQRACCAGEKSFGACRSGFAEVAGCKGNKCQCGKGSAFKSAGHCEKKKEKKSDGGPPSAKEAKEGKKSLDKIKYDQKGKDKEGGTGAIDLDDEKDDETPADCKEDTCEPYSKKNDVGWSRELGDSKIIAVYTGFDVTSRHPDANSAGCQLSWDNGLYMIKKKVSLLKFTAAGEAETDGAASMSGSVKLDLIGKTVWHAEGGVKSKDLTRQFRTPTVSLAVTYFMVINFNAEMDAGATVGLIPAAAQEADDDGAECTVTVKPGLKTDITAKLSISIGPKGIFELIKGGIGVRIIPLEVGLPITVGVEVDPEPISIDLIFKTKFEVNLLKGELFLFYDLWDTCKIKGVKLCLFKSLGIKTYGEKRLYKSKKGAYSYEKVLADIDQKLNFKKITSASN